MARLSAAYHGYDHQDLVAAYALASLLLPRADVRLVSAERKAVDDDRFDDLELGGRFRRRAQIKSHTAQGRCLQLADLTTDSIDFRIDRAVRSVSNDSAPADRYVLFATYSPCGDLLPFLQACPSVLPFLPGINTSRFSLRVDHIWPEGGRPRWRALGDVDRAAFLEFSRRFVIDVGCPSSSADLRAPGELEKALLALLRDGIGVGLFPNDSRDVADAAAHLVYAARALRTSNGTWREDEVIRALALRIDYGRVEEVFPVDDDRLVPRSDVLDEIVAMLDHSPRVAVTGPPGIGKSWLVRQLWSYLRDKGWIAVAHYCFVDLFDNARYRRASVSVTFGSIIAELYETDRSLVPLGVPRFAAGPVELEKVIKEAVQTDPNRRIAIIVDGLDHVDRLPGRSSRETASEIVEELAMVSLPTGVAVVVVSQPGLHLDSFLSVGVEYSFSRWPDQQMRDLVARTNLERTLRATDLEGEVPQIIDTIVDRAAGNPLYATYLVRTARDVAGPQSAGPAVVDIPAHLATAPPFDRDLSAYYEWLVDGIDRDTGVVWIGEMLALLDFAITSEELKQIRPDFRGHVDRVLNRLAPVLAEDVVRGGLRIYHESFQRHMRARLDAGAQPDAAAMLAPVIAWLEARGFFSDERAFRSLFMLLKRAGRDAEIPTRITDDFLARSAAHAQAGDAVMANLASAAILAASRRDWSFMARLLELSRACDNLYRWRLAGEHDLAQEYGRTYAELFGAKSLSDRLLYDGRCTFLPRPGLLLCRLCDYEGVIPPWREYIAAQREQERTENTMYGDEADRAIAAARLTGHLRLVGREKAIADCRIWLSSSDRPPLPHFDVATELGRMYGSEATQDIVASLPASTARAWTRLALAEMADTPALAQAEAERAIEDGLPVGGWRTCLRLGAAPAVFPKPHEDLDSLTEAVLEKGVEFDPGRVTRWLTEIALSAAVGSDDALRRAERRILPDTWYHKWLLFCLTLGRTGNQTEALLTSLRSLSDNTEVFKGEPRACDLLQLHGEIRSSFGDLLSRLDQDQWLQAFEALANICRRTTTYLRGSRCGPLTLDALLDLCHSTADTPQKRAAAARFGASLLTAGECAAEFYDTHAGDSLLLTRIHLASGEQTLAAGAWEDACRYLTGYGWRKDITVYEVLDSLPDLGQADPIRARRCIKAIQPVVEGVLVHTDGKETRHAIHKWLDIAAQIHPAGALAFLAHREVAKLPSIGYLDHAMPRALAALADQVDPVELAAGWLAVGAEARSEAVAAVAACEKAAKLGAPSGAALWNVVVASLDGDGVEAAVGLRQLAGESAVRLKRPEPEIDSKPPNTDDGPTYHSHALPGVLADELSPQKFSVPATPLQIPSMVRRWRDTAETQRADFDAVANAVGWRILELVEGGDEATAELVIRRLAHDVSPIGQDSLVATLAEGLKLRGHHRLAAFASALAYTSAYDGWLRFGGSKGIFLDALELDRDLTWSIFADELAGRVAVGGGTAVTTRLVQLLVAGGHIDQAFSSWEAACSVIASRLPRTGPGQHVMLGAWGVASLDG